MLLCSLVKITVLLLLLCLTYKLVAHQLVLLMSGLLQVVLLHQVLLLLLPLNLLLMLSNHLLKLLVMTLLSLICLRNGGQYLFLQPAVHQALEIIKNTNSILSLTKPILLWLFVLLVMSISIHQLIKPLCKH